MELDVAVVKNNAHRIEKGIIKYFNIMTKFRSCDASSDYSFQRVYKGFYRVRRNDEFCHIFFDYMESHKNDKAVSFDGIFLIFTKEPVE